MEKSRSGSRLLEIQARFQQKRMAEREEKIASLYETQQARALDRVRMSPSSNGVSTSSINGMADLNVHPGKVRQMFEERRSKAGIDKSYPLQPIQNKYIYANKKQIKVTNPRNLSERRSTEKKQINNSQKNGSGDRDRDDINHNHIPNGVHAKHQMKSFTVLKDTEPNPMGERVNAIERVENVLENETFPEALAPETTPRSPSNRNHTVKKVSSPVVKKEPTKVHQTPVASPRRVFSDHLGKGSFLGEIPLHAYQEQGQTYNCFLKGTDVKKNSKPQDNMNKNKKAVPIKQSNTSMLSNTSSKSRPRPVKVEAPIQKVTTQAPSTAGTGEGVPCGVCGRKFASDRVQKHESICKKSSTKKRKPFDALKHRLAGTEAEPFINKLRKPNASTQKMAKPLNNNWRQKHEEFIQAIRSAKQVQAHIAAGGKLADLPPPPPSENPDYVQCPHCKRRFNQAAAERHIPKCASYQYNKPKPPAKRR